MDVAWVAGEEGAEQYEDFSGCMCWSVKERCTGHIKGILEGGLAFWFLVSQFLDIGYVVIWVA